MDPQQTRPTGELECHQGDTIDLQTHIQDCKNEFNQEFIRGFVRRGLKRSTVKVSYSQNIRPGRHFDIRRICNTNVLVYPIFADAKAHAGYADQALTIELHSAMPNLFFENRHAMHIARWDRTVYPENDLDKQLDRLIAEHLALCDWAERELQAWRVDSRDSPVANASGPNPQTRPREELTELDMMMPTMRAILMLFWAEPLAKPNPIERAALVLTGKNSRMCSGPISLKSLQQHSLPGYTSNDQIVHVPLWKAAEFLAELDKREVAANTPLRRRNRAMYTQTMEERVLPEARERMALLKVDRWTYRFEVHKLRALKLAEEQRKGVEYGFSERSAALFAFMHC